MAFDRGHALLIGVGSYQHIPSLNVPITVDDARAVGQVLRDPRFCGYPEQQVNLLHDASADRVTIEAALDQLAADSGPDDTVLLFYCGHGDFCDDGDYYLTSHDTRLIDRKVVGGTGLNTRTLLQKLQSIRAQRVLLIFNACHSGAISPTLGSTTPELGLPPPELTTSALLATGTGRIIITACREQQYSYIGSGPLTLFTQVLVQTLLGKGINSQSGYISVFDLYTQLYTNVSQRVKQQYNGVQEPELTILKNVGPFAVALHRGTTTLGTFDENAAAPQSGAVHAVDAEASRRALQQALGQGVAVGGDIQNSTVIGRDQQLFQASGSQGAINQASGPITQHFGPQQNVQGGSAINSSVGGSIFGRLVINTGTITSADASAAPDPGQLSATLAQALTWTHQAITRARRAAQEDLVFDLEDVARNLDAAIKADKQANPARRTAKLAAAHQTLLGLINQHEWLQELLKVIEPLL